MAKKIILASGSPRRRELLGQTGLSFTVKSPDIEEKRRDKEAPRRYVLRNAKEKAAVVSEKNPKHVIISADTIVVLGNKVLEKPQNRAEAVRMLKSLSNKTHVVMTGVCVRSGSKVKTLFCRTNVTFKRLSSKEIARYISTGEPYDKAGGYAAQGQGAYFIARIAGSYTNVVGLPMAELCQALQSKFGIKI